MVRVPRAKNSQRASFAKGPIFGGELLRYKRFSKQNKTALKKFDKYFWVGYIIILIVTIILTSSCVALKPRPRYEENAYFYKRLENDGYLEVTVCNLQTGETRLAIIKFD